MPVTSNTKNATSNTETTINPSSLHELMKLNAVAKATKEANAKAVTIALKAQSLLDEATKLKTDYQEFSYSIKVQTDKVLYGYLGQAKGYLEKVEKSQEKTQVLESMRNAINAANPKSVTPSSPLETVVVKYVFEGLSRQTAFNYSTTLKILTKHDVTPEQAVDFIHSNGGITNLIQNQNESKSDFGAKSAAMSKEEVKTRVGLLREMLVLDAKSSAMQIQFSADVLKCYPEKMQKTKKGEVIPKTTKGNFVFFVGLEGEVEGDYQLIQAQVFDKETEDLILAKANGYVVLDTESLQQAVDNMKATDDSFADFSEALEDNV